MASSGQRRISLNIPSGNAGGLGPSSLGISIPSLLPKNCIIKASYRGYIVSLINRI